MEAEQFFEKHAVDGQLTDEQMARFLTGNGDTAIEEPPALDPEPEVKEEEELKEEKPVILAKDGVHTIEYEKLVEAREEAKLFKQEAESLKAALAEREALLENLKTAKAQDEETGTTEAMDALAASVEEDFPELLELMKFENSRTIKSLQNEMAELKKQIAADLAPVVKNSNDQYVEKHFSQIRDAHKDFDAIMESPEITAWVDSHPAPVKAAYQAIIDSGTAKDVIDMVSAFKATQKPATAGDTAEQIAKKAAAAEEKAKGKTAPKSLSDIPAGTAAHHDEADAMRSLSPKAMMEKFANKSSSEIMTMLDRIIK